MSSVRCTKQERKSRLFCKKICAEKLDLFQLPIV